MRALAVIFVPTTAFAAPQCVLTAPEPTSATAPSALASITDLGTLHGLRAVFARSGQHFQILYVAPDGQAVVGRIMWDAQGNNLSRSQVEGIPGTIPIVTIGSVLDAAAPQPPGSLMKAVEGTTYGLGRPRPHINLR